MVSGEYTIVDLNENHVPDVLRICRQGLGPDYHSEADFRKCLGSSREHFCKVILDDEGAVCGFLTAMMMGPESADEYLKLPDSRERDKILSIRKIGILDAAAIDNAKQKGGLGRLLARVSCIKLMEEGADVICSMAWKSIHGVTNAGKILVEIGLKELMAIEGYWNQVVDSPEGHHCPVCMEPPCRCYGVLYARYVTKG
ncbi:MAG: hypothetical protein KKG10_08480 [Proteobacteria bacterium]|nr:hypothetical protein [Pseudomonadota bacterium]